MMFGICDAVDTRLPMMFGICDAVDTAEVHLAGLVRTETAGQRYLVCSRDQYSTLELAEMAAAAGASGVDLAAWQASADVRTMVPKKPSTDNSKVLALLGRELVAPETSVERAISTLKAAGHL